MPTGEVLCVGELLWDSLPAGLFLGGAPFNVACHLRVAGVPSAIVSRVGRDRLGDEALRRAARYGVAVDLVQVDETRPTGFVVATIDQDGNARYEIVDDVAWDALEATEALVRRAAEARAIVFGTLAQRHDATRQAIEQLWSSRGLMVFDVNLRPPYEDRDVIRRSLERADVVKVDAFELERLAALFGLPLGAREFAGAVCRSYSCSAVVVTRGRDGAAMLRDGEWTEHPGFEVEVRDTVGSGDAFLATLIEGLLAERDSGAILERANRAGADVASQVGALPSDGSALGASFGS
jgi:fructokinase